MKNILCCSVVISSFLSLSSLHAREMAVLLQVEPGPWDQARELVDRYEVISLAEMEARALRGARLKETPWSGDYWPAYAGYIANRYADPDFPGIADWKTNFEYLLDPTHVDLQGDKMSPSEKYDLLVGDKSGTLTRGTLDAAKRNQNRDGKIERWIGLCHGWAAASIAVPRPRKSVVIHLAEDKTVTFRPDDIKALVTALWAEVFYEQRFIGLRCSEEKVKRDSSGRIENPECIDTNPATWHLAVVNQIGIAKRSFVADLEVGAEVWNHPAFAYDFEYFNPMTGDLARTLEDATVSIKQFEKDKFAAFRSKKAAFIVGISMTAEFASETDASTRMVDSPIHDLSRTMYMEYDLELDEKGMIVGGEWHSGEHPDFLWVPAVGAKPLSPGDLDLKFSGETAVWDGAGLVPAEWNRAIGESSTFGTPLGRIVDTLLEKSR